MNEHDNAYKHLFSHAQAVRDLLRGFVQEDWVALLDYDTLEKVSGSYVSDDLREREDDIIWRIRMRREATGEQGEPGEWVYVYLLLEFQSSVDAWMAVRILTYVGLLYQDLIKSGQIKDQLPAVFPLVLYNGLRPWRAEREIGQLIQTVPASLQAYRPSLRYFLMDEGRLPESAVRQDDNAIARLVQIERNQDPELLPDLVGRLANQLQAPQNTELRRAFAVWINRVVLRRFKTRGDAAEIQGAQDTQDLPEVQKMIGERIDIWKQQLMQQGMLQGKLEGEAEALKRLLKRRFGELPETVLTQIHQAGGAQIEAWFDCGIDADSLAAVFKPH